MNVMSNHQISQATHNEYEAKYQHSGTVVSTETAVSPTRTLLQKLAAKLSPIIKISTETLNLPRGMW